MIENIKKTLHIHNEIEKVLTEFTYDGSLNNKLSAAYFDISIEHHQSIIFLISHKLYGSAFSLVRPLYETYMKFLYLLTIDNENDIQKISRDKYDFPSMENMTKEIDRQYMTDTFFHSLKKDGWSHMNSYTHSGSLQLGRRFTEDMVQSNYTNEEIIEVLESSNMLIVLFAIGFFKYFGDLEKSKKMEALYRNMFI